MGKANISFPEGMLEEIDRTAAESGTTRSGFVQEAAARYLSALERESAQASRSERIERAIAGMGVIGQRIPSGPDGVTLLHGMRDAKPQWLGHVDDANE